MTQSRVVIAGALGECVHVAGVINFLRLAEQTGWQTVFLGPAVSVEQVLAAARQLDDVARHRAEAERRGVDQAELPVLEVVSAVQICADLTLGLGTVAHDYLA